MEAIRYRNFLQHNLYPLSLALGTVNYGQVRCEKHINLASPPTKLLETDCVIPNLGHVFNAVSLKYHVVHIISSDRIFQSVEPDRLVRFGFREKPRMPLLNLELHQPQRT